MVSLPKFFTEENDGVTRNAIGDYSGDPVRFILKPVDEDFMVGVIVVEIDSDDMFWNTYGDLPALTVGVEFRIEEEISPGVYSPIETLFDGTVFKQLIDWSKVGAVLTPLQESTTTKGLQIKLNVSGKADLFSNLNHVLTAVLNDNFSTGTLVNHTFYAMESPLNDIESILGGTNC